jgi:ribose 5-phosphate isomerase B
MKWFVGSDHAGFELKQSLKKALEELGDQVEEMGTTEARSCDYPDFAERVAKRVQAQGGLGLLVCGTGIGMAMAANRFPGIRAAVVTDAFTGRYSREHNDANIICMGQRVIGAGVAEAALLAFRNASFEGGRHQGRIDKITALDKRGG